MFIFLYPIEMERHAFDGMNDKDAAKTLYKAFVKGDDVSFYDMSTNSYDSKFANAAEFADTCNDEEIDLNNYWTISLNVSEAEMEEIRNEVRNEKD